MLSALQLSDNCIHAMKGSFHYNTKQQYELTTDGGEQMIEHFAMTADVKCHF